MELDDFLNSIFLYKNEVKPRKTHLK